MLYWRYSCIYWKRIFKNQNVWSFICFVFIFLSRWINSNKFESIYLNKTMKITENCFKNLARKWSLTKKTNLQIMYVRDFRPSILACKDYKINTKTLKIPVILLVYFFNCYLAAPQTTLDHYRRNSLTHPIFYIFDTKITRTVVRRLHP